MQKEAVAPLRLTRYPDALRAAEAALEHLDGVEGGDEPRQRARLLSWYAAVLQRQQQPEAAIEWCERTITEAGRADARDALAQAYFMLDWAYVALGRRAEAVYSERAIDIYEEIGDLDRSPGS